MTLRIASVAWKLRYARSDSRYFAHFYDLVSAAHDEGAEVVVFPELHVLELLPLAPELDTKDAAEFLIQFSAEIEGWIKRISQSSGMTIIGGSHFRQVDGRIKNVCAIGMPNRDIVLAEKNNLTAYEKEEWSIAPGAGLAVVPGGIGVTVCYDSEFAASGRALAEAGATVQCVPSWTETQRGFQRVRWSCLARAVENQIFVVHSSLLGDLGGEPVPETYGSSAIIAPSVEPFPIAAILRETPLNEEGVIVADLDMDMLAAARESAEVTNWNDRHSGDWTVTRTEATSTPELPNDVFNIDGQLN